MEQRPQKTMLEASKEIKDFDTVNRKDQQSNSSSNNKRNRKVLQNNSRYWSTMNKLGRCPAFSKSCAGCGRANHCKQVCQRPSRNVSRESDRKKDKTFHDMCQDSEETQM